MGSNGLCALDVHDRENLLALYAGELWTPRVVRVCRIAL